MEKIEKVINSATCEFSWKNEILTVVIKKKGVVIHSVDIKSMPLWDVSAFIASFNKEDLCQLVNENLIQL